MVSTRRILLRKTIRSVKGNYKQFISIVAISFLAICLFSGLTANYKLLEKRVNKLYYESNIADVFLFYSEIDQNDLNFLKTISEIESFEQRTLLTGTTDESNLNIYIANSKNTISIPVVTKGKEGFLISEILANKLSLTIGEELIVEIPNFLRENFDPGLLDGLTLEGQENILNNNNLYLPIVITGYMMHGEGVENSEFSSAIAYMDDKYLQTTFSDYLATYYNDLVVNYFNTNYSELFFTNQIIIKTNKVDEVVKTIDAYYYGHTDSHLVLSTKLENLASNLAIQLDISQAKKLTYVFPVIFFFVSILVIATTLSQMIFKERMQIGTLKAIGLTKLQIINHYASYGFLLCLIGSMLGVIIGPLLIPNVMNIKYSLLWEIPSGKLSFFYLEYAWCIGILLLLALVVSFLASRTEVQLLPVESMRPASPKPIKKSVVEKSKLFQKEVHLSGKMAIRNIRRNLTKSFMVIIGVLGCTALLVCGFGIMDTLNYGIHHDYDSLIVRDITVTYHATNKQSNKEELLKIDGVKDVEELIYYPIKISTNHLEDTTITLLEDTSEAFKQPYTGDGVLLSVDVANNLNVEVGDSVTITLNGQSYKRNVDGIFSASFTTGVFDKLSNYDNVELAVNQCWIQLEKDADSEAVNQQIANLNFVSQSMTYDDTIEYADEILSSIKIMTNVIKIFAILLAVVVIYNLASLNMKERTRDIATMKVLGFNQKEIAKTLILEIMILTFIGAFIGLFFGYPMLVLVMSVNKTKLLNFLYHIYFKTYLISFFISMITALVVNIVLARRTRNIKMVESLKSVE